MLFKEPKGLEKSSDVQFHEFTAWIQCHNLPLACMNPYTLRRIGEVVGNVEEIDEGDGGNCIGQYSRIRITREIDKALLRCVKITAEKGMEPQKILIRYKLPEFCQACGRIGHPTRHCDDQTVDKSQKRFGSWLKAARAVEYRRTRGTGTTKGESGHSPRHSQTRSPSKAQTNTQDIIVAPKSNNSSLSKDTILADEQIAEDELVSMEIQVHDNPNDTGGKEELEVAKESSPKEGEIWEVAGTSDGTLMPRKKTGPKAGQSPSPSKKKKKCDVKGWKRRARDEGRTEGTQYTIIGDLGKEKAGDNRGNMALGDEHFDRSPKRVNTNSQEDVWRNDALTAVAAEQPRRQQ